ncbi:hypothetical protein L7F22_002846 [Adiantum nelumboides]|nr:hypothetical protein [Adiantum nelumboides]
MLLLPRLLSRSYSTALQSVDELAFRTSLLCKEGHLQNVVAPSNLQHASSFCSSADLLLQECTRSQIADLSSCRFLYASLASIGLNSLPFAADHLLRAFSLLGSLREADMVFSKVAKPTLYTWNSIISAHLEHGDADSCLTLYWHLQEEGLKPDKCTFFAALKACSADLMILEGRLIHQHILRSALESVEVLAITLIDMYTKGGCLEDADSVFKDLPFKNVVSWNVMISGYAQAGEGRRALQFYTDLLRKRIVPNSFTYACILKVCTDLQARREGMEAHMDIVKLGIECDVFVGSAIVHMHAEFGSLNSAWMLFLKISNPNVVSWNALFDHYTQSDDGLLVCQLFERMQQEGVKPDEVTCLCVVKYCSNAGNIQLGKIIHDEIIKRGFERNLFISNTIIDMYNKVGNIEDGLSVFDGLVERDVVSWNAMLLGYAEHGNAFSVLALFDEMQSKGMKANEFTYACIVKACCGTGSRDLGRIVHEQILHDKVEVDLVLGNVLIDMYARCGSPEVAHVVLDDLAAPNVLSWNALISGYALLGNACMVDWCLQDMHLQGLKPNGGTLTSILTACSHGGQVKVGSRYYHLLQNKYGITTNIEHCNSLVDLFCRTGHLKEAEAVPNNAIVS